MRVNHVSRCTISLSLTYYSSLFLWKYSIQLQGSTLSQTGRPKSETLRTTHSSFTVHGKTICNANRTNLLNHQKFWNYRNQLQTEQRTGTRWRKQQQQKTGTGIMFKKCRLKSTALVRNSNKAWVIQVRTVVPYRDYRQHCEQKWNKGIKTRRRKQGKVLKW